MENTPSSYGVHELIIAKKYDKGMFFISKSYILRNSKNKTDIFLSTILMVSVGVLKQTYIELVLKQEREIEK